MNIEAKKYDLINWIVSIKDENLVKYLLLLKSNEVENFVDLLLKIQDDLKISIEQSKSNQFVSHKDQLLKYQDKLK
jgi:hypothetical protein